MHLRQNSAAWRFNLLVVTHDVMYGVESTVELKPGEEVRKVATPKKAQRKNNKISFVIENDFYTPTVSYINNKLLSNSTMDDE